MSEQATLITDRPSTDRPATENGTYPSMTKSTKLHPARLRIATFDDYAESERTVERRDFASATIAQAQRFDLVVDDKVAADAARLLDLGA